MDKKKGNFRSPFNSVYFVIRIPNLPMTTLPMIPSSMNNDTPLISIVRPLGWTNVDAIAFIDIPVAPYFALRVAQASFLACTCLFAFRFALRVTHAFWPLVNDELFILCVFIWYFKSNYKKVYNQILCNIFKPKQNHFSWIGVQRFIFVLVWLNKHIQVTKIFEHTWEHIVSKISHIFCTIDVKMLS